MPALHAEITTAVSYFSYPCSLLTLSPVSAALHLTLFCPLSAYENHTHTHSCTLLLLYSLHSLHCLRSHLLYSLHAILHSLHSALTALCTPLVPCPASAALLNQRLLIDNPVSSSLVFTHSQTSPPIHNPLRPVPRSTSLRVSTTHTCTQPYRYPWSRCRPDSGYTRVWGLQRGWARGRWAIGNWQWAMGNGQWAPAAIRFTGALPCLSTHCTQNYRAFACQHMHYVRILSYQYVFAS